MRPGLLAAIVALVFVGQITHGNYAASGDAVHYMVMAHSIAFDRDLDLANDYSDPARIITEPPLGHAQPGVNGVLRPVHDIGLPLLASPFFAAAYAIAETVDRWPPSLVRRAKLNRFIALRQLVSLLMIAATVALAVLFFKTSWRLTDQRTAAFGWALLLALSPPLLTHGYVFLTEIPSALVALYVYARREDLSGPQAPWRGLLLGVLTGLLVLIHARNIGLALALAGLVLWRVRHDLRRASGFAAGVALMAAARIAINLRFWGGPFTNPHEHFGAWPGLASFVSESVLSLGGLLFDARHGLLLSAPMFLLAPAALFVLWRARETRPAALELLLVVGAYLVFVINPVTNIHGWRGGWSPAARFLVPIVPFLALAVPALLKHRRSVRLALAVMIVQLPVSVYFWGHPMQQWSEGPGPGAQLQALLGRSIAGAVPAWEQLNGPVLAMLALSLAVWSALTWGLVRSASRDERAAR